MGSECETKSIIKLLNVLKGCKKEERMMLLMGDEPLAIFELDGPIPSKKNSRRALGGRVVPSDEYLAWEEAARWRVKANWHRDPIDEILAMVIRVYGLANDLDNLAASIMDMMQGIVYKDDAQVVRLTVLRHVMTDRRFVKIVLLPGWLE